MLRRNKFIPEVSMFSLIALYFSYRKATAERPLTVTAKVVTAANDRSPIRETAHAA